MNRKKGFIYFCVLFFLTVINIPLIAQDMDFQDNSFTFNITPRIWGVDTIFTINDHYLLWMGGGYETFYYYRDINSSIVSDVYSQNTKLNIWDFDSKIGYFTFFKKFDFYLLYKLRIVEYDAADTSLFGIGNLKEKEGIFNNSIFVGISYTNLSLNNSFFKNGFSIDNSFEYSFFNYLKDFNNFYPFFRLTFIANSYFVLYENDNIALQFNNRLIIDYLNGNTIPVDSLARIGGLNYLSGIGGSIRGVPLYLGDGFIKSIINTDFIIYFKKLLEFLSFSVKPGIVFFADMGITSGYERTIDFSTLTFEKVYKTTGMGFIFPLIILDIRVYGTYFINKKKLGYLIELGAHF